MTETGLMKHYLWAANFSLLLAVATAGGESTPVVPGVVIDHSPAASGIYIGSPSIAVLPNGNYVASHDQFGPKTTEHKQARTLVFRSADQGETWQKISEIDGQFWSSLFVHRRSLYIIGTNKHHGNAIIRRSTDGGVTWSSPTDSSNGLLRDNGEYHCAPMPVIEHTGRLWRGMEHREPPKGWGITYCAGMLSVPVDANLLNAANWTFSNFLPSDPKWLNGTFGGWLEGNAVVTRDGQIVDMLRVDTAGYPEKAAIVNISADGRTASFDPATGFVDFPGGAKKFAIRHDPKTDRYWTLATIVPKEYQTKAKPGGVRNTLALMCSSDLRDWTVRCILLQHPDTAKHGFQYVDWLFDGDDLIAACRTAYDDGQGGAHNNHDANYLTFHRIRNFRDLTMTNAILGTVAEAPPVKAFPTAEGFGAAAVGGRGGRILEVTNLNDSGDGSLRAAMEASGSRIVVFRVSGTITLKNAIRVSTPCLTVAGQTSPGGVQIRGNGQPEGDWGVFFVNGAHDIIVRHLRVRMGGNMQHDAGNNLLCYGTAEPGVHDVIFDHCSVCWGSDTQLDWYGSYLDRATFQWNIIAENFLGQHIGGNLAPKNITLHHNLYANLGSRTPLMQHADVFDFRNNVIYNWSGNNASVLGQFALNSSAFGNVVANLWLAGPESGEPYLNVGNGGPKRIDGTDAEAGGTKLYLAGNWGPRSPTGSTNDWTGHGVNTWDYYELRHDGSTHLVNQAQYDAGKPFAVPPVRLDPVSNLLEKVLATVGASKPTRDPIDQRIVQSVRDQTGSSRISTTGPWPDLATGAPDAPADTDHDGLPDAWEKAHGLDPDNPADGASVAANGYTHVENYLNELAGDPVPAGTRTPAKPHQQP